MPELMNLASLSAGSRIVVSCPGEPDRILERIWPVGDDTCWVSTGSRSIWEDLGNVAWFFDVTGQSDYPRNVIKLEQITAAPCFDDIRTLVESARKEPVMERHRHDLVVDRDPSSFVAWTGERLDMLARGLLSRVMGIRSRSRTAFPPLRFHLSVRLLSR